MERIYKQVPRIEDDMRCPICGENVTSTKIGRIMLYSYPNATKIINQEMPCCEKCDVMYATSHLCKTTKREQKGYWVAMFQPKKNANKEQIEHLIERYCQPKFEQSKQQVSTKKKYLNKIKIGNDCFEKHHISKCNLQSLPNKVCTTPVGFWNCSNCGRELLRNYVFAVQISDDECIKSVGCVCKHCNTFFTVSEKLFYNLEKLRVNKEAYELKSHYCGSYDNKKYSSIFNENESVYKQITVCSKHSIRTYTIVYERWETNENENIIYFLSEIAVKLLIAERETIPIIIDEEEFFIVKVRNNYDAIVQKREIEDIISRAKYFNNGLHELTAQSTVYIYNGKISCHNRHIVMEVKAYIEDLDSGTSSFFVEHCLECDKYLMKYEDYKQYLKKYHFFPTQLSMLNTKYDDYNRADNSLLSLNGYTTNEKEDLSSQARQKKLAGIIKSGVLSKRKVLDYLEMFIRESLNNPKRQHSIPKWEEDKEFVLNYSYDGVPKVFIRKIERRK